jgi:hypothetical protein
VRARSLLPLAALAALIGCVTTPREPLTYLVLAGSGPCTVDVDEQRFTLPADGAPLAARLRQTAKRVEGALVDAGEEPLSFACYREAMALIKKAGFPRLGLVTAAPPDPAQVQQPAPLNDDRQTDEEPT